MISKIKPEKDALENNCPVHMAVMKAIGTSRRVYSAVSKPIKRLSIFRDLETTGCVPLITLYVYYERVYGV